MEHIFDLRKRVAWAVGCKATTRKSSFGGDDIHLFCGCEGVYRINSHSEFVNGKLLVLPYETYHNLAIDALVRFCNKTGFEADIRIVPVGGRQNCTIWKRGPRPPVDPILLADRFNDSLAMAICEAIAEAAQNTIQGGG